MISCAKCSAPPASPSSRTSSIWPSSTRRCKHKEKENGTPPHCVNRARCDRRHGAGCRRVVRPGRCSGKRRVDRQLHLRAAKLDGEGGHHRHLDQQGRHPAWHRVVEQRLHQIEGTRHRRQLFVHIHHARHLPILLLRPSAHGGYDRGTSGNGQQRYAVMLDRPHQAPTASWTAGRETMTGDANADHDKARRFRDAALPHLDHGFTLARYLMRNAADAEDAVQECYLRALRHFDSYRGPAMKPWLLAILRNVCHAEFTRRGKQDVAADYAGDESAAEELPMWQEPQASPETILLRDQDGATIRKLIADLPQQFRETIVLREVNDLSYHEIAEVSGVPLGTVMSRLARARAMLRAAWNVAEGAVR